MPGRKNVPTNLKIIRGNPGKRSLPKNEPKPQAVCPNAPRTLCKAGKAHWRKTAKALYNAKVMTTLDVDALNIYCQAYVRWVEASEQVAKHGAIIKAPSGYPVQSPYLSVANKAIEQMKAFLVEFGMTPASRVRVRTVDKEDAGDGWENA